MTDLLPACSATSLRRMPIEDRVPNLTATQRRIIGALRRAGGRIEGPKGKALRELQSRLDGDAGGDGDAPHLETLRVNVRRLERARLIRLRPSRRPTVIELDDTPPRP